MANKSPITLLHELLQARKLPLPTYKYSEVVPGGQFRCTTHAAGETATAVATSKKLAKCECATIIYTKLKKKPPKTCPAPKQAQPPPKPAKNQPSTNPATSKNSRQSQKNYIGELNEYASKRHLEYPDYDCLSTTLKTGELIVSCSFLGHQALGKGKTQKEAKQESARCMLQFYLECEEEKKEVKKPTVNKVVATKEKKEKQTIKQTAGVLDDKVTKDIQELVNTINSLSIVQREPVCTRDSSKSNKMQIVINFNS